MNGWKTNINRGRQELSIAEKYRGKEAVESHNHYHDMVYNKSDKAI